MSRTHWPASAALCALAASFVSLGCSSSAGPAVGAAHGGGGVGPAQAGAAGNTGGAGTVAATAGTSGYAGETAGAGTVGAGGTSNGSGGSGGGGQGGTAAGGGDAAGSGGMKEGTAGQAGGSGSSGGGAGGAASCPGLLCEDFESGSIDPAKWDTSSKGGTLAVQTQQVAHGKYALHLQGLGSGSDDWATLMAKSAPMALNAATTFGRASMYFSAAVSASLHIQFPFAGSNGTGSGTGPAPVTKLRYLEVGSYNGQWQLSMDIHDVSPNIEDSAYAGSNIPTGKWVCIEWEFEDQPDRITLWVGGNQVGVFDNMHINYSSAGTKSGGTIYQGKNSGLIGVFDTFGIGFHDWHPTKAFDLYYDDVVLDTKRIGCPAQ
ncbi:MAG: hypothetical protein ABI488_03415 [Polyangiaceae bacterium]